MRVQGLKAWYREQEGSALVETALVLPLLLCLAFGVIAVGRLVQAQMGVSAVAREAARSAALSQTAADAAERGLAAGQAVAAGYGLTNGSLALSVEPGAFERGGQVQASARYDLSLADLPLLGLFHTQVTSHHVERIDLYRSRWQAGGSP